MQTQKELEDELTQISQRLSRKNIDYLLNVCHENFVILQIVHPVKVQGGKPPFGFAISLAFDDQSERHEKFRQSQIFSIFTRQDYQEIPMYYCNLGNDPKKTSEILVKILADVYSITDLQLMEFDLYEEGRL